MSAMLYLVRRRTTVSCADRPVALAHRQASIKWLAINGGPFSLCQFIHKDIACSLGDYNFSFRVYFLDVFLVYLPLGIVAGFVGGLFGVGGGVVVVPCLLLIFTSQAFPPEVLTHMALATSLAAMIVTSSSSAIVHLRAGAVQMGAFRWLLLGVLAGTWIGVTTAVRLTGTFLQTAFACFLVYVGVQMIVGFGVKTRKQLTSPVVLSLGGMVIGGISMLFGIGGGSMTVPFLSWRGFTSQQAVATSALLGVPIAILGAILYAISEPLIEYMPSFSLGYVYLPAFLGLVLTSIPSARFGAKLAHRLSEQKLRKCFGVTIMLLATTLLYRSLS